MKRDIAILYLIVGIGGGILINISFHTWWGALLSFVLSMRSGKLMAQYILEKEDK